MDLDSHRRQVQPAMKPGINKKEKQAKAAAKVAASNKALESKAASKSGPVAAKGDDEEGDIEAAGAEAEEGEEEEKVVDVVEEEEGDHENEDEKDRATYSTATGSPLPRIFLVSLPRGRKQLRPNIRGVRFYPSTSVGTARCLQIRFPIAACQPVASVVSQPLDTGPRPLLAVAHSRR